MYSILRKINKVVSQPTFINYNQELMSFCVYLVVEKSLLDDIKNKLYKNPYICRGKDTTSKFIDDLIYLSNLISELATNWLGITMLPLTDIEKHRFQTTTHCESYNLEFSLLHRLIHDHCQFLADLEQW